MNETLTPVLQLMSRATGDEKHSASALSTLDTLWVLYGQILHFDPQNPAWEGRDRFLLSKGHGPLALYAILAYHGFFPSERLDQFGNPQSMLGAHPDRKLIPGIEISTGSLGHGLPIAIGVTLGLRAKKSDRRVFVLVGDGECNEGSIWEAALLAPRLQLTNLTCVLINNRSSFIDYGDLAAKFAAFGWAATNVTSSDHQALANALQATDTTRPSAVVVNV